MPAWLVPLIWAAGGVGTTYFGYKGLSELDEAADSVTRLTKWGIVAGGLYVSYKALQTAGAIK